MAYRDAQYPAGAKTCNAQQPWQYQAFAPVPQVQNQAGRLKRILFFS
jgi:hypothetical protein